ncbi:MAG TPA: adenylosuccinate synthase [Gemmatales bacterium]|nr:adenylosuccinate synthase [Gemmatales bacterium]
MTATCVVGLQWGDEAKGKIVDLLAEQHDCIVRYNGGSNAGHTVVHGDQKFKLSLVPTGILRRGKQAVIANGVVVHPPSLFEELDRLRAAGVPIADNLAISDRAHVIFPYHLREEAALEGMSGRPIGTTGRGIGPCYMDKAGRVCAIRVGELLDPVHLRARLDQIVPFKNRLLAAAAPEAEPFAAAALAEEYARYGAALRPHVTDTSHLLHEALRGRKRLLFEGAQGSLLDLDHGTFPYVTSSNSSTAGLWSGSGVPARHLTKVVGVIKAYTTRVGEGPFPTELHDAVGEQIRQTGKEYGTVTGRPRRCGWFDLVAVRYSSALAGADTLAIMLLDVLSEFEQVGLCVAYEVDGERITEFPGDVRRLGRCQPVYEWLPGWQKDIAGCRRLADLPPAARRYLDRISAGLELPVSIVSVGPDRDQTIDVTQGL